MVDEEYNSDIDSESTEATDVPSLQPTEGFDGLDVGVDVYSERTDRKKPIVDPSDDEEEEVVIGKTDVSGGAKEGRDKNISTKKIYNTISCPCSAHAILDSNGGVACEKLDFGVKQSVKSMVLKNHYINGKMPRVGDKWKCLKNCEQNNFKWNAYHIVKVEESKIKTSSSLVNSILSNSNCYIPPTTLKDYKGQTVDEKIIALQNDSTELSDGPVNGRDLNDPITHINGKPLYASKDHIYWYTRLFGEVKQHDTFTYFKDSKHEGYIPFIDRESEEYVTSIAVNNKDIIPLHYAVLGVGKSCVSNTLFDSPYESGKTIISPSGGKIKILISGHGDPIFTLSLDDSSNCTVLKKRLKNIKLNNGFELIQKIPPLPEGLDSEVYTLKITPSANFQILGGSNFARLVGEIKMKIYQFAKRTITLSANASTISNTTQTSTNNTFTGETKQNTNVETTHTINVKRGSGTDNYYIKGKLPRIEDVISYDTVIKKKVFKDQVDGRVLDAVQEIIVLDDFTTDGTTVNNKGDVKRGMQFDYAIEKTKTVRKSIDLEEHLKEPCDDCDDELNILTNRFEIDNTNDLFQEMYVEGVDYKGITFLTNIKSIDCGRTITLEDEVILNKNIELTFKYSSRGTVGCVTRTGKGEKVELGTAIKIPKNTTINFENPTKPKLEGYIKYDKSGDNGVDGITVSTVITKADFGQENTTIAIDTDSLITNKPNACDQYLTVARGQETYIDFSRCDIDTNKYSKVVTITKQPNGGKVENATVRKDDGEDIVRFMKTYTPNSNFKGKDTIKYTTSDGVNSSDEKTIYLTVK
jgi:hypothetical protein